ncbi:DinB family protein [Kordiimonas gwangyangensis]|uniref:DinB family protein n=1 Tax=Kordiimonas gwangyangensis TaxID=288022 RepID=UPI00036BD60A|nr:DinB family protein [Kordiimonas gwangyangensis]
MSLKDTVVMMTRYRAWANARTYEVVTRAPAEEVTRERKTHFRSIAFTLNHVYVIDDIFRAHLTGGTHGYTGRNTAECPPLAELWQKQQALDAWYVDYAEGVSDEALDELVTFDFVDGGQGAMTRAEMLLHLATHTQYHRGFVGDMLNQIPLKPIPTDLPVYLREVRRA